MNVMKLSRAASRARAGFDGKFKANVETFWIVYGEDESWVVHTTIEAAYADYYTTLAHYNYARILKVKSYEEVE